MNPERVTGCVLFLLLLFAVPFTGNAQEAPDSGGPVLRGDWSLEQLEQSLGQYRYRKAEFRETHFSTLLTEPLTLRGTLTFTAPSRLEKRVTSPYDELYVVDEDAVYFESSATGASKTLSLDDFPSLRGFLDGLRAAFSGDLSGLKKFFQLSLDGNRSEWRLTLEPIHELTRDAIDTILISGKQDEITGIEIRESSGDYSNIEISPHPR